MAALADILLSCVHVQIHVPLSLACRQACIWCAFMIAVTTWLHMHVCQSAFLHPKNNIQMYFFARNPDGCRSFLCTAQVSFTTKEGADTGDGVPPDEGVKMVKQLQSAPLGIEERLRQTHVSLFGKGAGHAGELEEAAGGVQDLSGQRMQEGDESSEDDNESADDDESAGSEEGEGLSRDVSMSHCFMSAAAQEDWMAQGKAAKFLGFAG